jgi:hypothetical protein
MSISGIIRMAAVGWIAGTAVTQAQTAEIPLPSLSGPVPVTAQSGEPFRGLNEQPVAGPGLPLPVLQSYGYIEEEYFVTGTVDGKPYTTSLLVRKPKDAHKFSGVVAVETLHAQGAIPFWGQRDALMPGGHGWAMIVSQRSALEMFRRNPTPRVMRHCKYRKPPVQRKVRWRPAHRMRFPRTS